ncbi:conserved hypothetical protein [Verticillium alfalfae VaMs.102]|uniref:DASH complex subunit SPC34 n=1 Tax=Verticillium alfalfae (strain VaMs.102 / ATCC MYA-4576 / FGSC 10136) TaxID=526221 RepID=C9SGF8_VERA1|nr:conserved hypothetical protein [Verticillium alfalfae VaMs.102]EEY17498.1 conserved hypothetical protein [Verticillium alfalfae VaMs.102]
MSHLLSIHLEQIALSCQGIESLPPTPPPPPRQHSTPKTAARPSFAVSSGEVTTGGGPTGRPARRNTAVAAVLGGDLHAQLARRRAGDDVDVEVLLRGAEKLCGVYALPGAEARIAALRGRWGRNANTAAYYEARVAEQTASMERTKGQWGYEDEEDEEQDEEEDGGAHDGHVMTEEDLRAEEEEVRELERKKRELQARLRAMDKDLGGLLHM